jgi:hypothetical protein
LVRIQLRLSRKRYLGSKYIYEYERISMPRNGAYNTPNSHRKPPRSPPKLRLLPNKNGGQNERVAKKQLSPLHVSIRQKKNKTKLSLHRPGWIV